jgi:hypothetical protein
MKINYSNSDLTTVNMGEEESLNYARFFLQALGVPF